MKEHTKLRNINRGYMKLEVWARSIEMYQLIFSMIFKIPKIDFKLRAQIADAAQSVSSNIAEGYSRRSIKEYIQFLYIALGSLSETLTRSVGLKEVGLISEKQFEEIDKLHYEVENKLLRLVDSLEKKKHDGSWSTSLPP